MRLRLRPVLVAGVAVAALSACTPEEISNWVAWNEQDPAGAQAFANQPEIQMQLRADPAAPVYGLRNAHGDALWNRIARCESGGNWNHPPVTNRSGTYSGGLMIGHRWWKANGGLRFASAPYLATRAQQIDIAEHIAAASSLDAAWQCYP